MAEALRGFRQTQADIAQPYQQIFSHVAHYGRVNPLLIVDGANVVGSVPDGWWRDRKAAAGKLRDALAGLAATGLTSADPGLTGPLDIILVVEGVARGVPGIDAVRVESAPNSGDDAIVDLARDEQPRRPLTIVVTADRELRERLRAVSVASIGPRALPYP